LVHICSNQQDQPPPGFYDPMKVRKRIHHGLTVGAPKRRLCYNQIEMTGGKRQRTGVGNTKGFRAKR
jgi:hypothetical protein